MSEFYLRAISASLWSICNRIKTLTFLLILLLCHGKVGYAAVVVTPAPSGTNICSSKAATGSAPAYTSIGNIIIAEATSSHGDFAGPGTDVLVLNAPSGWSFTTLPTITYTTGSNITATPTFTMTATTLTISFTTNGVDGTDAFTINGLQVQANTTSSPSGYIYASSATGINGVTIGTSGTNFGNLSLTTPLVPSVTIVASPAGAICPGTNVVFTPTPVNGGTTPAYQWMLNGTGVATGATYANNALTNGNTVSCVMTASGSCLTATTAPSNTYTMTVNPGPLPVNGPSVTCPSTTISLSDNTTGGTWSSSNSSVASTDGSGNVTGVAVGTAVISYIKAGCPSVSVITVNQPPIAPALTTTSATMCSGDVFAITATGVPYPSTILSQTFNSGIAPWTVDSSGSVGTVPGAAWKACVNGYSSIDGLFHSPDNSTFAMSSSDLSGSSSYTSSKLISPVFSLAGYSGASLSFQQAYEYWPAGDDSVNLDISTDGGATWVTLQNYVGSNVGNTTSFITETFSLNAYLGQTNLRLQFNYYCHWGYYWAVDNVLVTGTSSIVIPTWAPTTDLYTDAAHTTPYTSGTAIDTVYVHPPSITTTGSITYTVSAVSASCSAATTSTVNFTPSPSPITGTGNLCSGSTTTLSDITASGTWSSGNTGVATVGTGAGVVTGGSPGTATISYKLGSGCAATTVVTVNVVPGAINGNAGVCINGTTNLSDGTSGGSWISSNTAVATIGSTGIVTSVATGTTNITYTLGPGCISTTIVTVNPLPTTIHGVASVCMNSLTNLSDDATGGTWSIGSTGIAIAVATTGDILGISAGTALVTYTLGTGCSITTTVTVNPQLPITGPGTVCMNATTTLSDPTAGGTWSSNNLPVATISSVGVVSGITTGTATISYVLPTTCMLTTVITVNPLPELINGTTELCAGSNVSFSDNTAGGTWSSGLTAIATVGSSGIVHGVTNGSTLIYYTISTGCFVSAMVTVDPLPQAILGTEYVCTNSSVTLSDLSSAGTWSSGNADVSIGSSSGVVTGVSAGTTFITYMLPTGCVATSIFTVNPLPFTISGNTHVCTGLTTSLSDAGGGTWTSSNTAVATMATGSGLVTGAGQGTATIIYTLATGCYITTVVTDDPVPGVIAGPSTVCVGQNITLTDGSTGGSWASGATGVATVGSGSGIVTGGATGTAVITYTLPTGCFIVKTITVNGLPGSINGTAAVCQGLTTSLSDATTPGTWSSSNIAAGSISNTGVVAGISGGTTTITYTIGTGCFSTAIVTVGALPPAILGTKSLCQTLSTSLSDMVTGGTWASSNTATAIVGSLSGTVTGAGAVGTAIITYTIQIGAGVGCSVNAVVTVNVLPGGINGPTTNVCTGASISFTDGTVGGSWSTSNTSIATIGSTGTLNGLTAGAVSVIYAMPTGCSATKTVNVNQTPAVIAGSASICQGATNILSDTYTGGTWASNNVPVASVIGSTGAVTGASLGTANITYTLTGGCNTMTTVTVNQSPGIVNGVAVICAGSTTNLTDATGSGTWSSSSTGVATIGSTSGFVNSISAGTANISYTLNDGCSAGTMLTVNIMPTAINGIGSVCVGLTTNLTDAVTAGTWSSFSSGVNVGSGSGNVTGITAGTAVITYGFSTGCSVAAVVTVNPVPGAIFGNTNVCFGFTAGFSDGSGGGNWTSTNTAVATIGSATGSLSTISVGSTTISYTFSTGCAVAETVAINPQPSIIGGTTNICAGTETVLTDSVSGGTWSSSNAAVATVGTNSGLLDGGVAGTATISYSLGAGCVATTTVTVNILPSSIAGNMAVCAGLTTTLSDPYSGGGTWSSSDGTVATVGSGTGVVSGIQAGTTTITYSLGIGCTLATVVTVNPLPSVITEAVDLCLNSVATLNDSIAGGTWSSGDAPVLVGTGSGTVFGVSTGTATVTYMLGTGCKATTIVTIHPLPVAISGHATACAGLNITLSDFTAGGTWSSTNTSVATVGSSTGPTIVNGLLAGTTTISYTLPTGCATATVFTVNPLPPAITGNAYVCSGLITNLSDPVMGGTWSSANATVNVGSGSGNVTGVFAGSATVTYTLPTGCIVTTPFTVNPLPATPGGLANVCQGLTITLTDGTPGGTWSSVDAAVGVGGTMGVVTGITAGTANITYTLLTTGCVSTKNITVNPLPTAILGPVRVCVGSSITLSDVSATGTWSSSNTAIATVGATTGSVSGVLAGSANITYTLTTGCITTYHITVDPLPASISGTKTVCSGSLTFLSDSTSSGTWSTVTVGIATIGSGTGIVAGHASGTTIVSYMAPNGCAVAATVTVNPLPVSISGATSVCVSSVITLTDGNAGGTWVSSNTTYATIGSSSGNVSGILAGSATITYTLPTGCITTMPITVNPLPSAIAGNTYVCQGLMTLLTDASGGGSWTSSNTGIATVGSGSGVVSGVLAGSAFITYTLPTGCSAATSFTVNPLPSAIAGNTTFCIGLTTSLSDPTAGGTWSSNDIGIATVASTGVVTGVAQGSTTITYTLSTGCIATAAITVNPLAGISGNTSVCSGTSTTLSDATGTGTWTSSNTTVATIGSSTGVVTGNVPGTSTITFVLSAGCVANTIVTINPLPSAINGVMHVCAGLITILTDATGGGAWSSGDGDVAVIDPSTGNVTGIAAGTTMITYTTGGTGCSVYTMITVNPLPAIISGITEVCKGLTTNLTDSTAGGTWSASDPLTASVSLSGVVTGVNAGEATITYLLPTGCLQSTIVQVDPLPATISGVRSICAGFTTSLSDAITGGTWASPQSPDTVTVAAIAGVVTGVAAGTASITYTLPTGCIATTTVTVNSLPGTITGLREVCSGSTITLSDAGGGTWTSGSTPVATIGSSSGVITGGSAGVANITYTLSTGCTAIVAVTVDPLPSAISGSSNICAGSSTTLSDVIVGGVWNISGSTGIAIIDSFSGVESAISAGVAAVTYTLNTGCFTSAIITVNPLPAAITGTTTVCVASAITLSDVTPGGIWSSSSTGRATVGTGSGIVTGVSAGGAIITYALGTGCIATARVTINALPANISGPLNVCAGLGITLNDATGTGLWTSGASLIATIGSSSGAVSAITAGTAGMTYTLGTGCFVATIVTVNPLPVSITGTSHVCAGLTVTLSDLSSGGNWISSATSICTVNATGVVTAISAGTSTITYQLPTSCLITTVVTVNPLPAVIGGINVVCTGSSTTLTDATVGGSWSTTGGALSISGSTGMVTGLLAGTALITYTLPTGCVSKFTETVYASPLPISGSNAVCSGSSVTLSNATASGTWSSSNTTVASVGGTSGIVTGALAGTANITYTLGTGCYAAMAMTVNPLPPAISGASTMCSGHTYLFSDAVGGGSWSIGVSSSGIASVGSGSGLVSALTAGVANITYTLPTGCIAAAAIVVNPSPPAITGISNVCVGLSSPLSDGMTGGTWSSTNTSYATIGSSTGIVNGVSSGSVGIIYTMPTGCNVATAFTVNPLPSVITGNRSVCLGSTSVLSDTLTGGLWAVAGVTGTASIGSASGIVTGLTLGLVDVTYTLPTGCIITTVITVNPYPAPITGTSIVCQGRVASLSDMTGGGAWGSSNNTIVAVDTSGNITGVSGGSASITYLLPTGCYVIRPVTVNPLFAITGNPAICRGYSSIFSDLAAGGTWSSSNTTVATINTAGLVTSVTTGITIVSYTLATGCSTRIIVTVNPIPSSYNVTGGGNYCAGGTGSVITLNGSDVGISYRLYNDTSFIAAQNGTGSALLYGPYTAIGTYTVFAVNSMTGCYNAMSGAATIGITPVVVPSVSVSSPIGDTACEGASTTFTALPTNGGSSPVYQWYVNAMPVTGTGNTYHYVPANGDIVSVTLTSDALCAIPSYANGALAVVTTPNLWPTVSIAVNPGNILCAGIAVTVTPTPVNGGSAPVYKWIKNGITAGIGSTYDYLPADGDNVLCLMHSNYHCLVTDSAYSSDNINFTVNPMQMPAVSITAHPGTTIITGESDTLIATVTNAGATIAYQWEINGVAIAGATSAIFTRSDFSNDDTVACIVTSNNACGGIPGRAQVVINVYNVGVKQIVQGESDIMLLPNPNNGDFIIRGTTSIVNGEISIEITDMLGQVVDKRNTTVVNGKINQQIHLDPMIANGMYLLHLYENPSSGSPAEENKVFHFVISK